MSENITATENATAETAATETAEPARRQLARAFVALSYDECRSLRKTASTETSRPTLHYVHVRPDVTETTNGHVLFRVPSRMVGAFVPVPDPDATEPAEPGESTGAPVLEHLPEWCARPDFAPWLFHSDILKTVRARQVLTVDVQTGALALYADPGRDGSPGELIAELAETAAPTADGATFPRTDQVCPRYMDREPRDTVHRVAFSGRYLKAFGEIATYVGNPATARVVLTLKTGEDGAARAAEISITGADGTEHYGLLMPLRILD